MIEGRLIIDNQEIDIDENVQIPLTFALADMKEPQDRKRSFSKTIRVPGTQNNLNFFASTYSLSIADLGVDSTIQFNYDPTIRVPAKYYRNGTMIFDGLCQLISVELEKKVYYFNIILFSNTVGIQQSLNEILISELGWSEYNHELNFDNIVNSWDTSVIKNGTPTNNFTAGVPDGFGYLYAPINYGYEPNILDIRDNNIILQAYAKEVLEKCFALAGQTITGTFIDSERFKRTMVCFGGGAKATISPTEALERGFLFTSGPGFSQTFGASYYDYIPPGWDISNPDGYYKYTFNHNQVKYIGEDYWSPIAITTDALDQVDVSNGEVQVARSGKYKLDIDFLFDTTYSIGGSFITTSLVFRVKIYVEKNGAIVSTIFDSGIPSGTTTTINYTNEFNFNSGDIVKIKFVLSINARVDSAEAPSSATVPTITVTCPEGGDFTCEMTSIQQPLLNGDTVNMAAFLPEMKAKDFVKDMVTAFNLYMSEPDINGNVLIESIDDFFADSDQFVDWTLLLDHSKKQIIEPAANIKGKFYSFRFAEDSDYWLEYYRNKYGAGYGDYLYQVQSTFQQETVPFEIHFAATCPVEVPGTNIIIPTIIQFDSETGISTPYKGKPRLLYYQGLKASDNWVLRNSVTNATSTKTSFPYLSHVDDYETPTFDLVFGRPEEVQWNASDYTETNLFNEYYYRSTIETTGRDSKIFKAYFLLNESHVTPESLRQPVMINGVLFRRNLTKDFQANSNESTFCELVKIVTGKKRRTLSVIPYSGPTGKPDLTSGGNDTTGGDVAVGTLRGEVDAISPTIGILKG